MSTLSESSLRDSRRRLAASLLLSALLHASPLALSLKEARIAAAPDRPSPLELRLPPPPPAPAPAQPDSEPLLKDTLSEAPVAAPPRPTHALKGTGRPRDARDERAAQRKLAEHLFYPPEAVAAGIEGEVRLLLTLDASGRVSEAVVASSSGHAALDRAALAAARAIGRLPGAGARELILPVIFRLE